MFKKVISTIFASKAERSYRFFSKQVAAINQEFEQLKALSHDELRDAVLSLRTNIQVAIQPTLEKIDHLKGQLNKIKTSEGLYSIKEINKKEDQHKNLDVLQNLLLQQMHGALDNVLYKAFAIVKETARRFKENKEITVRARDYDYKVAARTQHVTIQDDKAIWLNQWEVMGHQITWDMVHYDVQLIGGIVLHQGKIAEMATGEGKTLVATLAAFLNALLGKSVHIITVNDYLAKRDASWMGPLFEFHGLTVSCIDQYPPHLFCRKEAYQADIVYGTNNEFGFDYLRDNMVASVDELVQKDHYFAIVDEVDSVLIDDARTPLIISGPVEESDEHIYQELAPRIYELYKLQRELAGQFLLEAKKKLAENKKDEGGLALFRAYRALPKHKALIKYLSESGMRKALDNVENYYLQENAKMIPEADEPLFFTIDERNNSVEITEKGIQYLTQKEQDPDFFILPDMSILIADIESNPNLTFDEKLQRKTELQCGYTIKSQRLHVIKQLLKAYTLFEQDVAYIVANGKVKIVDEQTGRILDGRRYSDGLHQALEAKEGVKIERPTQTYASITLQSYFHMYAKLAGMTGTAETDAEEFLDIYGLKVVKIPTHKPVFRVDKEDLVYKTAREKFNAIIEEIISLSKQKRPVLVGTTSVEISEFVGKMLSLRKLDYQILNAKHHEREAQIVLTAGQAGVITIATNMAGRGTDIKLSLEAKAVGGLAIIGTERHESRRVDRQLRGRAGRQEDPGTSQFFLSLEDSLMRLFGSDRIISIMDKIGSEEGEVIQHSLVTRSIERAQKKVEQNNFAIRKRLLEYDKEMGTHRKAVYQRRNNALMGKGIDLDIMNLIYDSVAGLVDECEIVEQSHDTIKKELSYIFSLDVPEDLVLSEIKEKNELTSVIYEYLIKIYQHLREQLRENFIKNYPQDIMEDEDASIHITPIIDHKVMMRVETSYKDFIQSKGESLVKNLEQSIILTFIDQYWKEHLRAMDDLKQAVQNAVYEHKDPIIIYKFEAYTLFKTFIYNLSRATASYLFKALKYLQQSDITQGGGVESHKPHIPLNEGRYELYASEDDDESEDKHISSVLQPLKSQKVAQRNDRVTVRYQDGTIKQGVKFKNVEDDLKQSKCVLLEKI